MTGEKDNSSLPLLFVISGAVLLVAVGGWYLLDQEPQLPAEFPGRPVTASASIAALPAMPKSPSGERIADERTVPKAAPALAAPAASTTTEIEAELIKARLAAEADILVFPLDQSALHYYANALQLDEKHPVANAELDSMLARVATTVSAYLAAKNYRDAYDIALAVAALRPEHALVSETQQMLDNLTETLVNDAIQRAQNGDYDDAEDLLASAESLPGRNSGYFVAVRDSIAEIRSVREEAERDRIQRSRLAAEQAKAAWVDRIRAAIQEGRLIRPAGSSAQDLLAERNSWDDERLQMSGELLAALIEATRAEIDAMQLAEAEKLLDAVVAMGGASGQIDALRTMLERGWIDAESSRLVGLDELVRLKTTNPVYPRRAEERGLSGWVDVEFRVTPEGGTSDVRVIAAEPEEIFDRAAINAVEQWEFEPPEFRGKIISKRAGVRLVFRLE